MRPWCGPPAAPPPPPARLAAAPAGGQTGACRLIGGTAARRRRLSGHAPAPGGHRLAGRRLCRAARWPSRGGRAGPSTPAHQHSGSALGSRPGAAPPCMHMVVCVAAGLLPAPWPAAAGLPPRRVKRRQTAPPRRPAAAWRAGSAGRGRRLLPQAPLLMRQVGWAGRSSAFSRQSCNSQTGTCTATHPGVHPAAAARPGSPAAGPRRASHQGRRREGGSLRPPPAEAGQQDATQVC